jgi:thiamine biosynthesis protein ThiI
MRVDGIVLHYAEIATKGRNRPAFVKRLAQNVGQAIAGLPLGRVRRLSGRLWIESRDPHLDLDLVAERLGTVYGLSHWSPARRARLDLEAIKEAALEAVRGATYETFRVSARRAFKDLPLSSLEVDREVGAFLVAARPAKVKLKGADLQVYVEMTPAGAYIYTERRSGLRGLPVGITGHVAGLLSGGIDSPVAVARMQRRGCRATLIHFHSHPFLSRASQEKAVDLAAHLTRFQRHLSLYLVPFGELQRDIVTATPPALRVVLYRRFMLRLAGRIGQDVGARALVTGESLAQVASQTLTNMVAIDPAAPMPVLRPLVGYDKQEIIEQAQGLGTYETSILPDQDCCTLFIPKNPQTHARLEEVEAAEERLDVERMCEDALARAEQHDLRAPWVRKRTRTDDADAAPTGDVQAPA